MATSTSVKFDASHHAAVVLLGLGAILVLPVLPLARMPLLKLYWQRATSVIMQRKKGEAAKLQVATSFPKAIQVCVEDYLSLSGFNCLLI